MEAGEEGCAGHMKIEKDGEDQYTIYWERPGYTMNETGPMTEKKLRELLTAAVYRRNGSIFTSAKPTKNNPASKHQSLLC